MTAAIATKGERLGDRENTTHRVGAAKEDN